MINPRLSVFLILFSLILTPSLSRAEELPYSPAQDGKPKCTPRYECYDLREFMIPDPQPIIVDVTTPASAPLRPQAPVSLKFHLKNEEKKVILPDRLGDFGGSKIRLIAVDSTLTDLQYLFPQIEKGTDSFVVSFKPATPGPYRFYIEALDAALRLPLVGTADIGGAFQSLFSEKTPLASQTHRNGYDFALRLPPNELLPLGKRSIVYLHIDRDEQPVTTLEPLGNNFAYMIGLEPETGDLTLMPPLKIKPTVRVTQAGPELKFQIEPASPGKMPLFLVVRLNGQILTIPFVLSTTGPQSLPSNPE